MKNLYIILAIIFTLAGGCSSQQPDSVKAITPAGLNQILQKEDIFLVDVHTPEQQHIKGTDAFIPYNEIEKYQSKLPQDKNTAIYVYCQSGPMGSAAASSLYALGYRNLINLDGGAEAWRKAGLAFQ
jgi:rhodanese-related sulfurtransferase